MNRRKHAMWRQTTTSGFLSLVVVCSVVLGVTGGNGVDGYDGHGVGTRGSIREYFKPPSPCLTGPSCQNCVNTKTFYSYEVCCYHCRLDNLVISSDMCHCIDTRLPDSLIHEEGNCSSGQICDNCAVQISSDVSEGPDDTPGVTNFCCQDCGIAMPYLHRDDKGCRCVPDAQGRVHQIAPRYDPDVHSSTPPSIDDSLYYSSAAPALCSMGSSLGPRLLGFCAAVMATICSSYTVVESVTAIPGTRRAPIS